VDGHQHRPSLETTSKKEARRRAIQLEAEIIQGRYQRQPPPPALAMVIQDYQQFLRTEGRARKTLVKYSKTFERLQDLAERRHVRSISEVDLKFIDAFRSERVQAGAAKKTVFTETVVVRQLVNFALSRGLVTVDPLKGLRLKKPKPTRQPCWTPAEVEQIIAASHEPERFQFIVLADTGMRVGELKYLTWEDVDFQRNVLHIRPKEGWQPKTGDQRAIPLTPRVRSLLESLSRRSQWVFCARPSTKYPRGDHQISERHLLVSLKRLLKGLGLKGHLHTFRHAFISHALTQGIPEAIVREWVGHVDAEVIKLYTHIADTASQAAMQRLSGAADKNLLQRGGNPDGQVQSGRGSAQVQHNDRRRDDDQSAK
jgi:integrase